MHKLRHEFDESLSWTNVACRLLDHETCKCSNYPNRRRYIPDCVRLTAKEVAKIDWLPPSCAYRRIDEGKGLAWWHPLVSGDPNTVHEAGISVSGRAIDEREAGPLEQYIVSWPGKMPRVKPPKS